jgi:uncharacterized protein (DUF2062 family)
MMDGGRGDVLGSPRGAAALASFSPRALLRYLYRLRTEGGGRGRQAAAIGLGVFIGCTPFYGAHFWLCLAAGWALRLNRLKLYLAANISNPFFAPVIVLGEIQVGSLIRQGTAYSLSLAALRAVDPWLFAADLLAGSVVVGGVLGAAAAAFTWAVGQDNLDQRDEELIAEAAASYLEVGIAAWERANGKLRYDPVYREVVDAVPLPHEGRVLDLGCGRGLMLAWVGAHYRRAGAGSWGRVTLHGIDHRPRLVRLSRRALGDVATIEQADLATCALPACRVAVLVDVLHCLPEAAQESLLARVRDSVAPGGYLALREPDAAGGWRFGVAVWRNRAVAILQGRWRRRVHFRTGAEWQVVLRRFGFTPESAPLGRPTPSATVFLWARRHS